ncbi:hypothetical protein ABK040_002914 [Willaertia magna]
MINNNNDVTIEIDENSSERDSLLSNNSSDESSNKKIELKRIIKLTFQLLLIEGIYSYFIDHSLLIFFIRMLQLGLYYQIFRPNFPMYSLYSLKYIIQNRKIIFFIITISPIIFFHVIDALFGMDYMKGIQFLDFIEPSSGFDTTPLQVGTLKDGQMSVHTILQSSSHTLESSTSIFFLCYLFLFDIIYGIVQLAYLDARISLRNLQHEDN